MFIDEATIQVTGGRGGDGCVSFRREKFVPKGGPDGGDGGNGGSVYLLARDDVNTLLDFSGKHHWRAENGRPGSGANRHGRRGEDLTAVVPTGTLVYDADSGALLKDMVHDGQRIRIARGGRGGQGNARFATPTHQTPRESTPGRPAQERTLRLQLKLIADVGLVGLPNAGKSTLLSRLSRARPKIAAYPFTTKHPHLGILELPGFRRLVIADIPGLIEGAHGGAGLGDAFLRHIERTRVIVHLVDLYPPEGAPPPAQAYGIIRNELARYSQALAERSEIVVANKIDLGESPAEAVAELREAAGGDVFLVSGVSGAGLREVGEAMWRAVEELREAEPPAPPRRFEALVSPVIAAGAGASGASDDEGDGDDDEIDGGRAGTEARSTQSEQWSGPPCPRVRGGEPVRDDSEQPS
jgi:GTP-binding protein